MLARDQRAGRSRSQPLQILILLFCMDLHASSFYAEGNLLYWQAKEEGLVYAEKISAPSVVLKEPSFEWDFGFKVGVGFKRDWDVSLFVTQFNTHADAKLTAGEQESLIPLWLVPSGFEANQIKMHWRLHSAFIDALLSKKYTPHVHLALQPKVGVRYALARQKFNFFYSGGDFAPDTERIGMKNKFWGVGPYMGGEIEYLFFSPFSLCAEGSLSVLYGQFYVHENARWVESKRKISAFLDTFSRILPIAEGSVLLRYKKGHLTIQAGWDLVLLFSQNHLQPLIGKTALLDKPGNLSLKGVQGAIAFNF
jgi:hypothetical protein